MQVRLVQLQLLVRGQRIKERRHALRVNLRTRHSTPLTPACKLQADQVSINAAC